MCSELTDRLYVVIYVYHIVVQHNYASNQVPYFSIDNARVIYTKKV